MSKKTRKPKKATQSRRNRRTPRPATGPSAHSDGPAIIEAVNPAESEAGEDAPDGDLAELTFRQQSALPVIAVSRTVAEAAGKSGVPERTLRRWLTDTTFRKELDRMRRESYDLVRRQVPRDRQTSRRDQGGQWKFPRRG